MAILITGGAGFIGSKINQYLIKKFDHILILDNLSRGKRENIEDQNNQAKFTFVNNDVSDFRSTFNIIKRYNNKNPITHVWHLAANSDIPAGISNSKVDLKDTFMTTYVVLEIMKILEIKNLFFSSSSAIYGDHGSDITLNENIGPLLPISNYGAMKLASEAIISAAAESFLDKVWIFRFPNVIGAPATHGVILDFINKLKKTPYQLNVLGNGTQQKAYLHIDELIEGMFFIYENSVEKINLYNIGPEDEGCLISDIAKIVVDRINPRANIIFGKEVRGWIGDVPKFRYSIEKVKKLGWEPKLSSIDAVKRAVNEIAIQEGFN